MDPTSPNVQEPNDSERFSDGGHHLEKDVNATTIAVHNDEPNAGGLRHECVQCGKLYKRKSSLKVHQKRIHPERYTFQLQETSEYRVKDTNESLKKRSFECKICGAICSSKKALKEHGHVHIGEKVHQCNMCLKRFSHKQNLNRHYRVHTGERPYQCDICLKRFRDSTSLKHHKHLHTGEKEYECEICKKTFIQKGNLRTHRRVHTGEKPYECDICLKMLKHQTS